MRDITTDKKRQRLVLVVMIVVVPVVFFALVCLGRYAVGPLEVFKIMAAGITGKTDHYDPFEVSVVLKIRLPRVLMGMLVGAGLSVAGAAYQGIFGNPLVSPDILGVSSGAGFGASIAILMSASTVAIQSLAVGFGLLAVFIVLAISRIKKRRELFMLVLSGVIVRALFDALVSLIKYVSDPQDKLPAITLWLMGSLSSSSYRDVLLSAFIILPCIVAMFLLRWKMNILSLDEEEARSLGVNVKRLRLVVILISTMITAVTVSLCGIIGWIGLVIPHVARLLVGNDHRVLLPVSALLGSVYLLLIDTLARAATSAEIPLSILTAVIGAPFFAWMLRRTTRKTT